LEASVMIQENMMAGLKNIQTSHHMLVSFDLSKYA
jgi:hypothetical protein